MAARRFQGEAEKWLCEEYEAGATTQALADKYNTERITVARTLRRNGVKVRGAQGKKPRSLSKQDEDEIIRRYLNGEPVTPLARAFGTHYLRVSFLLRQRGVYRRRRDWKGGKTISSMGYVLVLAEDDLALAMAGATGYVMEHRLMMARALERPLEKHETIHHINGDKADNRLENLQLRNGRHGRGKALRCRACGSHDIEAVELA